MISCGPPWRPRRQSGRLPKDGTAMSFTDYRSSGVQEIERLRAACLTPRQADGFRHAFTLHVWDFEIRSKKRIEAGYNPQRCAAAVWSKAWAGRRYGRPG